MERSGREAVISMAVSNYDRPNDQNATLNYIHSFITAALAKGRTGDGKLTIATFS